MVDFYYDQPGLFARIGLFSDRPARPPDTQAMFWAIDTQKLYAANDAMNWYEINPDPPAPEGEYHLQIAPFVTDLVTPNLLFFTPVFGATITKITVRLEEVYDIGVTCTLGDDADVDRFFVTGEIDLQTQGEYVTYPNYSYLPGGSIKMYGSASSTTG